MKERLPDSATVEGKMTIRSIGKGEGRLGGKPAWIVLGEGCTADDSEPQVMGG